ncbi:MAG: hypothetical protein J6S29_01620 [Methanosphaera sp.]|nr:hypothetical protein [Methanosphaera sp.]
MKRKMLYVFVSLIFICLLSTSIVCAQDNATQADEGSAIDSDSSDVDSTTTSTSDNRAGTLTDFRNEIEYNKGNLSLNRDYELIVGPDSGYVDEGIVLNDSNIFIEGNNHTINLNSLSRLFTANNSNIIINNLNIRNTAAHAIMLENSNLTTSHVSFQNNEVAESKAVFAIASSYNSSYDSFINLNDEFGSAIHAVAGSELTIANATFNNSKMQTWGCIYLFDSGAVIANTTFADMKSKYATAIYGGKCILSISNCTFINLEANETAGAIAVKDFNDFAVIENCKFINVTSHKNAGALFADVNGEKFQKEGRVLVTNSTFEDCQSLFGGAILQLGGSLVIVNSTLTNNDALINGGGVYTSNADMNVINTTFTDNSANEEIEDYNQGGAIFFDCGELTIENSTFKGNDALEGSDIYLYDSEYTISNSYFAGNISSMFDADKAELTNNTFLQENKYNDTNYIYVYDSNGSSISYNPITLDESLINATSFDLRDYGLVTPVKNQGDMGSCWAFGITGALESAYLKATNKTAVLDISESNIQDSGLMYSIFGMEYTQEGSYRTVGSAYMLSWLGVTTSDDNTYDELGKISPIIDNGTKYHIHNVVLMMPRQNITDNQKFKKALVKYGAVGVSVHGASRDEDFNEKTNASYFHNERFATGTDHSVTLVGWNDSYPRTNFITTPPGDGAWIVKNSWGTNWADNGYYYVSYYDTAFGTTKFPVAFIIDDKHDYEKNYQYDIISDIDFNLYEENLSYANRYVSIGKDLISAVGTYFNDSGVNYKIDVFVNDEQVHTQSGVSNFMGFETIKLDKFVGVDENDTFVVEINAGAVVPISSGSRQHYTNNSSVVGRNGKYDDLYSDDEVACIKVYTIPDNSYMEIEDYKNYVQIRYFDENGNPLTNARVSVVSNGLEYIQTTDENGVALFQLYLPAGQHTVAVINPVSCKAENIILTIPSEYKKPSNTNNAIKKAVGYRNVKTTNTLQKTYKVSADDHVIFEGRYFTVKSLNDIFGQNFTNGHLVVYLDGKVVFNDTVDGDIYTIIFEIIDGLLGNHELKVEFTVGNDTQGYEKNITIS